MSRSLQTEYYPGPVPRNSDDLPRYLESEFTRIRESLIAQPVALTIQNAGPLDIGALLNWQNPFIGIDATWDVPGGSWDPITGIWTCPQMGLYQASGALEIDPFGTGNKNYYAGIQMTTTGVIPGVQESFDGGDDDIPLGVSFIGQRFLSAGDALEMKITAVHENQTGTVDAASHLQILRVSA